MLSANQEGAGKAPTKANGRRTAARVPNGTALSLTAERDALAAALKRVTGVVETRHTIPITGAAHIAAAKGNVTITGTDLTMWASEKVAAEVLTGPFAVAVNAHKLEEVVSCFPAGSEIKITTTSESGARLKLACGRLVYNIGRLKAEDFPHAASVLPFSVAFTLNASELHWLLSKVSHAMSTEETRYYLNGVYLHEIKAGEVKKLRAVATDGHRLARADVDWPQGAPSLPTEKGIIVGRKCVGRIVGVVSGAKEGDEVSLALSPSQIKMVSGDFTLTSQLVQGSFPDYARVIPLGNKKIANVGKESLLRAVDHVSKMSSAKGRAVKLKLAPDSLVLSSANPDAEDSGFGDSTEEIDASFNGSGPLEIGFNASYATDLLGAADGEELDMQLDDPSSPAVIVGTGEAAADAPLLFVLMPMRV